MIFSRLHSGLKKRRGRNTATAKISARVVVVFVVASLLVGAVAISLNIKLEEQESALPHPLAHR